MEAREEPFLLTREQAVKRYGIPLRTLVRLYQRNRDFPLIRIGRSVMIHREMADAWFTEHIQTGVETN